MKIRFFLVLPLLFWNLSAANAAERSHELNTASMMPETALETVLELSEPPGNIAVTKEGRVFFTIHPESKPEGVKLYELKNGAPVPFPDENFQTKFKTVLGLALDGQNRLWAIDHGGNGFQEPKIFAFDLGTNRPVHEHSFAREYGQFGSYFNDLRVTQDGKTVFIADISFLRRNPAIVVYDTETGKTRRVLEKDASVKAGAQTVFHKDKELRVLGFFKVRLAVDGIALDTRGEWLYYAPMNRKNVFRVKTADLLNEGLSPAELSKRVETYGPKPFCDGIEMDARDNLYITDIEHGSVFQLNPEKELKTFTSSPKIRWPDGMSASEDGYLYFTDSALANVLFKSPKKIRKSAPFYIYRLKIPVSESKKAEL